MKRFMCILAVVVMGLMLVNASVVAAQPGKDGSAPPASGTRAINNQTAVACNLCFTCGGDWTVFAGSLQVNGGNVFGSINRPTERGSGCSGVLTQRQDTRPFLCCR